MGQCPERWKHLNSEIEDPVPQFAALFQNLPNLYERPVSHGTRVHGACGHTYLMINDDSHALVSCPQLNGVSCSYGSYYLCSPHVHAYPSNPTFDPQPEPEPQPPTPTPTPDNSDDEDDAPQAPPKPAPPPPPAPDPICPAHAWTNCGGTVSHATTCPAGHNYYSCYPRAVAAHSGHTAPPPAVCPADDWTNCGGTVSHSTTCGRGHSYYSCNPDAVRAHSWH